MTDTMRYQGVTLPKNDHEINGMLHTVNKRYAGIDEDLEYMKTSGRKQELHRKFTLMTILGFSSTLIGTWEVILDTLQSSLTNGGTAGLFWGYLIVVFGFLFVYLSLAEMASMAPSSGGQYHWVSEFAPDSAQRYLSFVTGWLSFTGWQSGLTGIAFMAGGIIQGLIVLNKKNYILEAWHGTLLIIAITSFSVFFNTIVAKRLPLVEGLVLIVHILGLFAVIIVLWTLAPRNNAHDAFLQFTNNGGWSSNGTSVMAGLYPLVISLLGFDSPVHMSEEIKNAGRTLPMSIIASFVLNTVLGLIMIITIIFTWGDMNMIAATDTGLPFLEIFYNTTHSLVGTNIMTCLIVIPLIASCIAVVATASRQIWAFARDNGVPFSQWVARVNPTLNIPLNAVLVSLAFTAALSLINIGSSVGLNAVLSLNCASLLGSYLICITCLLIKRIRKEPLPERFWSLGRWGMLVNIGALFWLSPVFVFTLFPGTTPVTLSTMNWGALLFASMVIFSTFYYLLCGYEVYISPKGRMSKGSSQIMQG